MTLFRRLLNRDKAGRRQQDDVQDKCSLRPETAGGVPDARLPSPHDLQVGLASDPGRVRNHNEDASLVCLFTLALEGHRPVPMGLFVVADGMGGHSRGEQASAQATRLVAEHVIREVCLPHLSDEEGMAQQVPINEVLWSSIQIAHRAVSQSFPEAGTTLTLALVAGDSVHIAHVGDSRAYIGGRGQFRTVTTDHSVAARLVEMGQATPEEVEAQRNILYRAVGQGVELEPDITYHDLQYGQYLLLCCDGLWGKVPDAEISRIVEAAPTADIACQDLVARANANGGEDNISVVLAARGWPPSSHERKGPADLADSESP